MPRIDVEQLRKIKSILKKKIIFTFVELLLLLNCSIRTGRSKLKEWQTYNSYNKNGKFYTMPNVPHFNERGLWCYKGVCFSKHGNLQNTVVHLVNQAQSGLTGKQIGEIVGLPARSFLHHFRNSRGLLREKHDGVYVYFSDDPDIYRKQVQERISSRVDDSKGISDMDAIVILVALIKHRHIGLGEICGLPEIKAQGLARNDVEMFFKIHELEKKTPDIKP
jgi:hypothetical protein